MPFQELSPLSTKIAYVLGCIIFLNYIYIVNFGDVCTIESKYLKMWSKNQTHPYITAQNLLQSLNMTYLSIFKNFFAIYSIIIFFYLF